MQPKTQGSPAPPVLHRRAFTPGGAGHQQFPPCLQKPVAEAKFHKELPRTRAASFSYSDRGSTVGTTLLRILVLQEGVLAPACGMRLPQEKQAMETWGCGPHRALLPRSSPVVGMSFRDKHTREIDLICHRVWRKCSSLRALSKTVELMKGNWEDTGRITEDTG